MGMPEPRQLECGVPILVEECTYADLSLEINEGEADVFNARDYVWCTKSRECVCTELESRPRASLTSTRQRAETPVFG